MDNDDMAMWWSHMSPLCHGCVSHQHILRVQRHKCSLFVFVFTWSKSKCLTTIICMWEIINRLSMPLLCPSYIFCTPSCYLHHSSLHALCMSVQFEEGPAQGILRPEVTSLSWARDSSFVRAVVHLLWVLVWTLQKLSRVLNAAPTLTLKKRFSILTGSC